MKIKRCGKIFCLIIVLANLLACVENESLETIVDFEVNPRSAEIKFYWKDEKDLPFKSLQNLKTQIENNNQKLRFAMNGGIYDKGSVPLGLFIENSTEIVSLNKQTGEGNFYLQPNGVFYLTENKQAFIKKTEDFINNGQIEYATQSGPMLVIDQKINPQFKEDSENVNIRNGVCLLENSNIVFSISRKKMNLYNFAKHFQNLGCQNALYLDGFVSRMYFPEKNMNDLDGDFAVIIAVAE